VEWQCDDKSDRVATDIGAREAGKPSLGNFRDACEGLVEAIQRKIESEKPPDDSAALVAAGWINASPKPKTLRKDQPPRPLARLFLAFRKDQQPAQVLVSIGVSTADQTPDFPLVLVDTRTVDERNNMGRASTQSSALLGGAIPIFWEVGHWPAWFPFCQIARVMPGGHLAPDRLVWHVRFKIAFIVVDVVILCALVDRLDTAGCLDVIMSSVPEGEWADLEVPPETAQLRVRINSLRVSLYPTSDREGEIELQADINDAFGVDWVLKFFWQTCCTRVVPQIACMHARFQGSSLESHFNDTGAYSEEQRALFFGLHQRLQEHLQRRAGGREPFAAE